MEVLESLHGNGQIIYDETWATTFLNQVNSYVVKAEKAALKAESSLEDIKEIVAEAEGNSFFKALNAVHASFCLPSCNIDKPNLSKLSAAFELSLYFSNPVEKAIAACSY